MTTLLEMFECSRYMDFDADDECIIGLDIHGHEINRITASNKLTDEDEFSDDDMKIPHNNQQQQPLTYHFQPHPQQKRTHRSPLPIYPYTHIQQYQYQQPMTPSPDSPQNSYRHQQHQQHPQQQQQQQHNVQFQHIEWQRQGPPYPYRPPPRPKPTKPMTGTDRFDASLTHKKLIAQNSDGKLNYYDTYVREEPFNGEKYVIHGTQTIDCKYKWNFILWQVESEERSRYGANGIYYSTMTVGLVDAATNTIHNGSQMKIGVDTKDPFFLTLFSKNGGYSESGLILSVTYDKDNKYLTICNETNGSDKGKNEHCCHGIDTSKDYKLCIILDRPAMITMF